MTFYIIFDINKLKVINVSYIIETFKIAIKEAIN